MGLHGGGKRMNDRLNGQLDFLIEADKMKSILRQTLLIDKSRQENDAEHSWHFALMAMTLAEYAPFEINLDRVIRMALVHDLVEIYAGDTFAYDTAGYQSKEERENKAADKLFSLLPHEQGCSYRALWEEFDAMQTPDAIYAAAIDRLQPFINNALTDGHTWVQHGVTVDKIYKRMAAVKDALPALWEYVADVINENLKSGRIKPDPGTDACP
jgi:putative hydrolase of HD superfamily